MRTALAGAAVLLVLASAGAGARARLAPELRYSDVSPAVSPDGFRIAFIRNGITPTRRVRAGSLYTVGSKGRGALALTRGSVFTAANEQLGHYDGVGSVAWSPDGRRLVYQHAYQGTRYDFQHSDLVVANADGTDPQTIVATTQPAMMLASLPSWSSRNEIVFVADLHLWIVRPNGTGLTRLTNPEELASDPSWSPDGTEIVYSGGRGIAVIKADGTFVSVVFGGKLNEGSPVWSPDGTRIAFSAEPGQALDIYTAAVDGSDVRRLTTNPAADFTPSWTPDGRSIVFASNRGRGSYSAELWIMNADGSHQRPLMQRKVRHAWNGRTCTMTGTVAADQVEGTPKADVLCALAGDDLIFARDHHSDFVDGGPGRDRAQIDKGLDEVRGVEKILP